MKLRYLSLCLLTAYLNAFSMNQLMHFLGYKKNYHTIYDHQDVFNSSASPLSKRKFLEKCVDVNTALIPHQKDFTSAYFHNADFYRKDLRNINFEEADLTQAYAWYSDAEGANFNRAALNFSIFNRANLKSAQLKDAQLFGIGFVDTNLQNADLRGAEMTQAGLMGANFTNADLRNANLTIAKIDRSTNFANVTRYDNPEQNRDWLTVMSLFAKISQN